MFGAEVIPLFFYINSFSYFRKNYYICGLI